MNLSWFGHSYFLLEFNKKGQESVKVAIDPFSQEIGLKPASLSADLLLISHNHYDHNNTAVIKGSPFVVNEPGEYELKDVFVKAIPSFHDNKEGKERGSNLIFSIFSENLRLCHLGDLGQSRLTEEQLEVLGTVDILMIPVGGFYTLEPKDAKEVINQLEPKIVIPMHYALPGLKIKLGSIDDFLKIINQPKPEPLKKLKIQDKDLPTGDGFEVVLLQPLF
jgi:L-ascorbate metabolism protein UlaG (beta-lactamase superfamily)